jgi:hypothetical protein
MCRPKAFETGEGFDAGRWATGEENKERKERIRLTVKRYTIRLVP